MKYVLGVNKRYNYTQSENHTRKGRKFYFCYEFDLESCKFGRIRISFFKAIYYKTTFVFGLKYKMVGQIRKDEPGGILYCENCEKKYFALVNFWDRDLSCPRC